MDKRRGFRTAVCRECGAVWPGGDARYCGRCGAALPTTSAVGADRPGAGNAGGRWRRALILIAAVGVVAVVGTAVAMGATSWLESDPGEESSTDVELPDPDEMPDPPDEPDAGELAPSDPIGCEPDGCELWSRRSDSSPNHAVVMGDTLVDVEFAGQPGGSSLGQGASDEDQPRIEALVSGRSTSTGRVLWEVELEARVDPDVPSQGSQLVPLDRERVLLQLDQALFELDAGSGGIGWVASIDHPVHQAARGSDGEAVVWGRASEEEIAEVEERRGSGADDDREAQPGPSLAGQLIRLTGIDATTGDTRWSSLGSWVMAVGRDQLILLDDLGERLLAVDLANGEPRWEREAADGAVPGPAMLNEDLVVLMAGTTVEVLDARNGEMQQTLELDREPVSQPRLVGDLLMFLVPGDDPSAGGERTTAQLYDLADLGGEPRRIENVVDVVPLREHFGTTAWGWQLAPPIGIAVLTHEGVRAHVELLEPDGSTRWTTTVVLAEERCCARLHRGRDAAWVVLESSHLPGGKPIVVSTEDGTLLAVIDLPPELRDADDVLWIDGMAMARGSEEEGSTFTVAGPEGFARVAGTGLAMTGWPVPVFQGEAGFLAIDPALLFGDAEGSGLG